MALRGAIASLTQGGPYTATRTTDGGGYDADGLAIAGSASTFSVAGSLQPVSGRELRDLPEGQRGDETRVIYTLTELRTRTSTHRPDVLAIDGEPWTVIKVERFDAFGDTHYRAYVSRTSKP